MKMWPVILKLETPNPLWPLGKLTPSSAMHMRNKIYPNQACLHIKYNCGIKEKVENLCLKKRQPVFWF